jgi:hypothetical protein
MAQRSVDAARSRNPRRCAVAAMVPAPLVGFFAAWRAAYGRTIRRILVQMSRDFPSETDQAPWRPWDAGLSAQTDRQEAAGPPTVADPVARIG